jgi:thymidylate synthase (FAD)
MNKGYEQKILDHGYVRLIDWMGTDETIVEAARMSTKKSFISWDAYHECEKCGTALLPGFAEDITACKHEKRISKPDGDQGLLEYLWKNNHATPFEMCELAIEVQAPIMVFREWHRSRTQSYNEMSARYTVMPNLHYIPEKGRLIAQATKNKQAASVGDKEMDLDTALAFIEKEQATVYADYEEMVEGGVPKEVARINCPVSRYSKMRAKTDLRNWLHFLNLRMRPNAQWEIRQYANAVAEIIEELFPRTYQLFEEYTLHAESFSRTEMVMLRKLFDNDATANKLRNVAASDGMDLKRIKALLEKLVRSKA